MNQIEPLDKMDYPILFRLLFRLNLVTGRCDLLRSVCHVQSVNNQCLDLIGPPNWFNLYWIKSYDSVKLVLFGDLNKLSKISYSLSLLIIYAPMFFSSPLLWRWWNMPQIMFRCTCLVQLRPHAKYLRTLMYQYYR